MMTTVGLTGGIGSGKTTIANLFATEFAIPIYIADTKAKELIAQDAHLQQEIKALLGEEAFVEGKYNTAFVASIVFSTPEKLQALNQLIHPYVQQDFARWREEQHSPYVIKESAILFESGSYKDCDYIIDRKTVEKRIKNQWNDENRIKLSTFVVDNRDFGRNLDKIQTIHCKIMEMIDENAEN